MARMSAASALEHLFVKALALEVTVDCVRAQKGLGAILSGALDDEVLEYLQRCPSWAPLHAECLEDNFATQHRRSASTDPRNRRG